MKGGGGGTVCVLQSTRESSTVRLGKYICPKPVSREAQTLVAPGLLRRALRVEDTNAAHHAHADLSRPSS